MTFRIDVSRRYGKEGQLTEVNVAIVVQEWFKDPDGKLTIGLPCSSPKEFNVEIQRLARELLALRFPNTG